MARTSSASEGAAPAQTIALPSLRRYALRHRRVSAAVLGTLLIFVALMAIQVATSGAVKLADSTACSNWGSSRPGAQLAYARAYIAHHGTSHGATPASVVTAINDGCIQAYAFDEADSITVLQAIRGQY